MKKRSILKNLALFFAMVLPACSLGMTQKNLTSGKTYISALLEKYANDIPQFNLTSASVRVRVDERYTTLNSKKKEVDTIKSSFSLNIDYISTEEKPYYAMLTASRINQESSTLIGYGIEKNADGTYQVKTEETDRVANPNEDFYSYYDVPYFLNVLLNRNAVRFLDSTLSSVKLETTSSSQISSEDEDDEVVPSNILTGYNINYNQNNDVWNFAIYSDYKQYDDDEIKFGFDDASYTRFFRYSGVEAVPASSIKYTFINDRVSEYKSLYSYYDEELKEEVRGTLTLEADYGEEREKTEI